MSRFYFTFLILGGFALISQAEPKPSSNRLLNLNEVVAQAIQNDPELASAIAGRDAGVEAKWQGLAGLLPSVTASYQKNPSAKSETINPTASNPGTWSTSKYSASSTTAQIRQPLFRPRQIVSFIQGLDQADQAEWRYRTAFNQAIIRSLSAYGDWLIDEANTFFNEASVTAAELKELQISKMRQSGLSATPDVAQSKADKHRAKMELALAKQQFLYSQQNFYGVIGNRSDKPSPLNGTPDPKTLEFTSDFDALLSKALLNNPEIRAAEKAVHIANSEVKKNWADHAPTVDLVASYSDSDNFNDIAIGRRTKTTAAGILVTVPIFQGGSVLSATRQSSANLRKAEADLVAIQNKVRSDFHKAYGALSSARERWSLAHAAIESAKINLLSTSKQEIAGLKSKIDTALAKKNLLQAQRDEIQAKSEWILAKATILGMMGDLESILGQEYIQLFSKNF